MSPGVPRRLRCVASACSFACNHFLSEKSQCMKRLTSGKVVSSLQLLHLVKKTGLRHKDATCFVRIGKYNELDLG